MSVQFLAELMRLLFVLVFTCDAIAPLPLILLLSQQAIFG